MKYLLLLLLIMAVTTFAQQADSLDRLELNNNKILEGKVVKITSSTVQFKESLTNLLYEYQKSEIRDLRLSNGTVLSFNEPPQGQTNQTDATGAIRENNPPSSTFPPANTGNSNQTNTSGQSNPSNVTGSNTSGNNTASGGRTTNETTNRNVDTTRHTNTNPQPAPNENSGGLSTPALLFLAAGGVIVLLLLGKAIF